MAKAAKKPADKSASEAAPQQSPFEPEFLEGQRQLLLAERARYVRSADALKAEADALANEREPGDVQFDEESGEGDTLAVERERDLALSAQARAAVDLIDAALARLDKGTYGICVHSGLPIPAERLEAIPWAAERVEYKAGSFRS
jgi:RNA polymerase-binding transcription factor DksA